MISLRAPEERFIMFWVEAAFSINKYISLNIRILKTERNKAAYPLCITQAAGGGHRTVFQGVAREVEIDFFLLE